MSMTDPHCDTETTDRRYTYYTGRPATDHTAMLCLQLYSIRAAECMADM